MKKALLISEMPPEPAPDWLRELAAEFALARRTDFPAPPFWADTDTPDAVLVCAPALAEGAMEFCRQLRVARRHLHLPVLWLSAEGDSARRIEAFAAGVDDCVALPIDPRELVARLKARLRMRTARENQVQVRVCGNLKYDPVSDRAWVGPREVAFTLKQKELISYFMDHPRAVVTRKELLGAVWPHASVSARTIDAHLTLLRRKLQDFDHEILSVHSIGYRLEPVHDPA